MVLVAILVAKSMITTVEITPFVRFAIKWFLTTPSPMLVKATSGGANGMLEQDKLLELAKPVGLNRGCGVMI
jgi:hypothetical protein